MGKYNVREVLRRFPGSIPQRTRVPEWQYQIEKTLWALRSPLPRALENLRVTRLKHEQITIVRLPSQDVEFEAPGGPGDITAVYLLQRPGPLFVPTGRVFIHLDQGKHALDITRQLEQLGFRIIEIPKYAPYSGWVEHQSSQIDRALTDFEQIQNISGVENVEPQMLTTRSLRHW